MRAKMNAALFGILICCISCTASLASAEKAAVFSPLNPAAVFCEIPAEHHKPPDPVFDPRKYGARGDGLTYDTAAIQKAIDDCAGTKGSVVLSPGSYLSAQLTLKAGMTFYLEKGAVLLGGLEAVDYPDLIPDDTPATANRRSLLYACKADGLVIDGEGVIDGRGKDVKLTGKEPLRPSLLRIFQSKDVVVRNVTFRNPKMWTQVYSECEGLTIDHVQVDAPSGDTNLDGMDVCDSSDVQIRNCRIDSEDDSICLKSHGARGLQRILVENNLLRCRRANAIKLGTATHGPVSDVRILSNVVLGAAYGGICIESVDGSAVSDVLVSGLEMKAVGQPIFIRLARRAGGPPESTGAFGDSAASAKPPAAGSMSGIIIEKVRALQPHARTGSVSTVTGIPGQRVKNVTIRDALIEMPGGSAVVPPAPPEKEKDYPQSNLLGDTPAWAFYVRHADGVVLENVTAKRAKPDARQWLAADDAKVQTINCRDVSTAPETKASQ